HAIQHRQRATSLYKEIFGPLGEGGEATIEADRQPARRIGGRMQNLVEFIVVEGQWLFDEDVFVSLERLACEFSMRVVSCADDDQICVRVVEHLIRARHRESKSETLSDIVR